MTESYQSKPDATGSGGSSLEPIKGGTGDAGRTVLIGMLGGLLSAAGYVIYQRLPEDQKVRLQRQARSLLESRLSEIRSNFNI